MYGFCQRNNIIIVIFLCLFRSEKRIGAWYILIKIYFLFFFCLFHLPSLNVTVDDSTLWFCGLTFVEWLRFGNWCCWYVWCWEWWFRRPAAAAKFAGFESVAWRTEDCSIVAYGLSAEKTLYNIIFKYSYYLWLTINHNNTL